MHCIVKIQYTKGQNDARLFITTLKHNIRMFGVIPFINYKTTLQQQLNSEKYEKWERELIHLSFGGGGGVSCVQTLKECGHDNDV